MSEQVDGKVMVSGEVALVVAVKGEVVESNLPAFREFVRGRLGEVNVAPVTDEEFGQAEMDVVMLKEAERKVRGVKEKALADAESLYGLLQGLDEVSEEIRVARLDLEKVVKRRKEELRVELLEEFVGKLVCEGGNVERLRRELEGGMKGKRTLESMRAALVTGLAIIQGRLGKVHRLLEAFERVHGGSMTHDRAHLEMATPEVVEYQLQARLKQKELEDEVRRERGERERLERERLERVAQGEVDAEVDAEVVELGQVKKMPMGGADEVRLFAGWVRQELAPRLKARRAFLVTEEGRAAAAVFAAALNGAYEGLLKMEGGEG